MKPRATNWLKASRATTIATYCAVAIAVVSLVALLGDEFARHVGTFEAWVGELGPRALWIFAGLYALLTSLFVPDTLLGIVAGASLGFGRGVAAAFAGCLIAATVQYALARSLLKPAIDRVIARRPSFGAIQGAVLRQQLRLQFLIRLTPLNRSMTNYVLGAAGVRFSRFLAADVGLLPSLCLEVYFGYASKHLAKVATGSDHAAGLHEAVLVVGLLVAIAVTVLISRTARKAVEAAAHTSVG